jgi:two-component system sensor histidine kinase KdpD
VADDPADGLLDVARGVNASQVLIGASRRGRVSTLVQPGVGEEVIARSGEIDVHVVTHDYARGAGRRRRQRRTLSRARLVAGYLLAVVGTALLSAGLVVTPDLHGLPTEALLLLTMVVVTALVGGLWPAVLGAILSSLALNFLFVPPTRTLTIEDPENAFAILVFVLVGVAVATVVDRSARRMQQAVRARTEANALAVLAHSLLRSGDDPVELLRQTAEALEMNGAALVGSDDGQEVTVAAWGATSGAGTTRAEVEPGLDLVLTGPPLEAADQTLLTAYAAHFAVLQERRRARAEALRAEELAEGNRTKTALLAAVSHDLRSPLAAIKAATSSLRSTSITWSAEDREELLATVEESADRLDALVANLLDMSRLQTQSVAAPTTEVDLVSVAEWTLRTVPGAARIQLTAPDDLPPVVADPGLLERVIANVVENALKHTDASRVRMTASLWDGGDGERRVSLRVVDRGPGVPADSLGRIFEPFQRLGDVPAGDGVGLGLAVARGLMEAMGGTVAAEETPGGGLTMVIDLPAAPRELVLP